MRDLGGTTKWITSDICLANEFRGDRIDATGATSPVLDDVDINECRGVCHQELKVSFINNRSYGSAWLLESHTWTLFRPDSALLKLLRWVGPDGKEWALHERPLVTPDRRVIR